MLLTYWQYGITKNWNYMYHEKMMSTNIFCYGKSKSKKTESVGYSYLLAAIERERSIVLYAPKNNEEYKDVVDLAGEKGYQVLRINANEPITEHQDEMIRHLPSERIMICIDNDKFEDAAQYNNADRIISQINDITKERGFADIIHVVLDGLCGNMLIQSAWLQNQNMKFCIIMSDMIANLRWRIDTAENLCNKLEDAEDPTLKIAINSFRYDWDNDFDYAMCRFFRPIETVICTGVNNVKPQDQREFVSHCFFGKDNIKGMGGRFCIEEYPRQEHIEHAKTLKTDSNIKPIQIEDNIEDTGYKSIAEHHIIPNRWIIEVNNRVQVMNARGIYVPVVFTDQSDAKKWVEMLLRQNEINVLDCIESKDVIIYSIPATIENPLDNNNLIPMGAFSFNASTYFNLKHFVSNPNVTFEQVENGELESEITILRVKESEVQNIQMNYLINVLEIAEAEIAVRELCNDFIDRFGGLEEIDDRDAFDFFQNWKPSAERELDEKDDLDEPNEIPDEYRWKPYIKAEAQNAVVDDLSFDPVSILPKSNVLFLGGHQNMTKKLRQVFPEWEYISDDLFKRGHLGKVKTIFFWTAHSSHSMMEFINARKNDDTAYIYVTATNINRLISEMAEKYLGAKMI